MTVWHLGLVVPPPLKKRKYFAKICVMDQVNKKNVFES